MLGSLFLNGIFFLGLAWTPYYWIALIFSFCQGVFAIIFNINNTTLYQQRVPDHLRGRVFSVRILLAQAGVPIGAGLGSIIAETFSISILFLILGCLICLTTIICFLNPIFNKLNDNHVAKWDGSEIENGQ
ncbi:MFS transporter [Ferdinandcohnia quinoae]|uniref:MFS transporter n=1 Tax=Fredinandcohnia quinoae TaxID=2918902 RepID=A0AAW5EGC5_9BACI|nr:MFS transporter [Fredinandcohnia sp. SECRCQ15]MCH1627924.1 MFS transporter [Fredinandcohnia sp. SECRCQ15]